jgi:hypothetical protein
MSARQAPTALMIVSLFNNDSVVITLICMEKVQRILHMDGALAHNATVIGGINYGC